MKTTSPLIIGNWKMNPQSLKSAQKLLKDIKTEVSRIPNVTTVVAPPHIFLTEAGRLCTGKRIRLAAQTTHQEKLGAFTGETSIPMLESVGVSHIIIGHSERRAMGETEESINQKLVAILKAKHTAIVCVGEKKRDQNGKYFSTVEMQIRKAFAGVPKSRLGDVVVAYEPIWAIGTGKTATPEDAHEMKLFIQKVLADMYGRIYAQKVRIVYGGSVNAKNAEELFVSGEVDGFLIGGASLRASEFATIAKLVSAHV